MGRSSESAVDAMRGAAEAPSPFKKLMAANRAEIAVRIMRAATELNVATVAIYGYEDRFSQHRWGADQSFQLEKKDPADAAVRAYLDIEQIVALAKREGAPAPLSSPLCLSRHMAALAPCHASLPCRTPLFPAAPPLHCSAHCSPASLSPPSPPPVYALVHALAAPTALAAPSPPSPPSPPPSP